MNINILGRRGRGLQDDDQIDVYEDDAERLYESFNDLYDDFGEGRSKAPFVIIGALLAVAIVGGGLAFAYKRGATDGADGVAVIEPDRTATKVEPDDPGGIEIPHQDREIYQQFAGEEDASGEEVTAALAPGASPTGQARTGAVEEPAASSVPETVATAPRSLGGTASGDDGGAPLTIGELASRVATGEPGSLTPAHAPAVTPAPPTPATAADQIPEPLVPGSDSGVFEPRQVRTVSIAPDGSVIDGGGGASASSRQLAPATGTAVPDGTSSGEMAPIAALPDTAPEVGVEQVLGTGTGAAGSEGEGTLNQTSLMVPSPRPKPRPTTRSAPVASTPAAVSTRSRAAALQSVLAPSTNGRRTGPTSVTTTAAAPRAPAPTTAAAPRAAAPAAAPASSSGALTGYAVQVASHRQQAEAVAAFADLQQRYPSLISGLQPLIQRADLGDRGIYYRLRIGPLTSRSEADQLCSSLRSAGLPGCLVRQL